MTQIFQEADYKKLLDIKKSPRSLSNIADSLRESFEKWVLKGDVHYGIRIMYMSPYRIENLGVFVIPLRFAKRQKNSEIISFSGIGHVVVEEKTLKTLYFTPKSEINSKIKNLFY